MNKHLLICVFVLLAIFSLIQEPITAQACTGIQVKTTQGTVIRARTMEFGHEMKSDILFFPRGQNFKAALNKDQKGMQWKNKYAFCGFNIGGTQFLTDGMNEKGLYVGGFYFPDFAAYQPYQAKKAATTLSQLSLGDWILGNFSNVKDLKKTMKNIRVSGAFFPAFGKNFILPVHWIVADNTGKTIVIEHVKGKLILHDNPLGVFSNSPPFEWHMINLRNYVNLSPFNVPKLSLKNLTLNPIGQGSGMLGLPGDFTPPSRFVRAVALSQSAVPVKTDEQGVNLAWHIINNVDIMIGGAREIGKDGTQHYDYTQWVAVYDLKNLRVYFRTYNNLEIKSVDLKKLDPKGKKVLTLIIRNMKPKYQDISHTAR